MRCIEIQDNTCQVEGHQWLTITWDVLKSPGFSY